MPRTIVMVPTYLKMSQHKKIKATGAHSFLWLGFLFHRTKKVCWESGISHYFQLENNIKASRPNNSDFAPNLFLVETKKKLFSNKKKY